ncbi:MAG: hypothetical protein Q8K30_06585 [Candidatus Gracilibacteria bacterium]|nr:hypothetical protein [Candidatus Gracilibacteria bacterium]
MKKILIIILLISIIPNYTYANGACLIQDRSAEVLLEYIKNNKKVVKNVTKGVVKEKNNETQGSSGIFDSTINKVSTDFSKAKNGTISIFNELFNYSGFYSYFDYFSVYPISNEIPYQVKRDYKLLERENEGLINFINKIDTRLGTDTLIKNACDGVDTNCNLNNKTSKEIIGELIQNNDKILDLYRLTVMGESASFEGKLILVDNNFNLEIEKNYGINSISECNSIEGGFFDTITKAINNIKLLNQQGEDGIQMWRDAWDLMLGTNPDTQILAEKEVMRAYLSDEGISMENQNIMNDNLIEYQMSGLSVNNNYISNTIAATFGKINNQLLNWKDAVVGDFFEQRYPNGGNVTYKQIQKTTDNSKKSIELKERIAKMYNDELPYAAIGDINTETLRAKIIETHMSLDDSINILENTIKVSQKVCTSQDAKRGKCK